METALWTPELIARCRPLLWSSDLLDRFAGTLATDAWEDLASPTLWKSVPPRAPGGQGQLSYLLALRSTELLFPSKIDLHLELWVQGCRLGTGRFTQIEFFCVGAALVPCSVHTLLSRGSPELLVPTVHSPGPARLGPVGI